MQKLYPIANKATRHLFIEALLSRPTFISGEGYVSGEMTSYIKPGKVPNLAELCQPEGVKFTVTEEPNPETIAITGVVVGLYNEKEQWSVAEIKDLSFELVKDGPARSVLDGHLVVPHPFKEGANANIPITVIYERGTRALTISGCPRAGLDTGIPQVLGIKLNLDHRDAKLV